MFVTAASFAQQPKALAPVQVRQVPRYWEELVGKVVVVEGIAWGLDKGRGFYVVYNGGTVNVRDADFGNKAFGSLVRVYGRFARYPPPRLPFGAQAPRQLPEDRYAIETLRIEPIDRVRSPRLREHRPERREAPSR